MFDKHRVNRAFNVIRRNTQRHSSQLELLEPRTTFQERAEYTGEVKNELRLIQEYRATYAIITPTNKLYVIDSGTTTDADRVCDYYKNVLGFDEIEGFILTHYHNHHIGGLPRIIERFEGKISNIYANGYTPPDNGLWDKEWDRIHHLNELLNQYPQINYEFVSVGKKIEITDDCTIHFINPSIDVMKHEPPHTIGRHPNDYNCVGTLVTYGNFRLLMLADIVLPSYGLTKEEFWFGHLFKTLKGILGDTKINVLQIPHHGDTHFAWTDWMYTLSPDLSLMDNGVEFTEAFRNFCISKLNESGGHYFKHHMFFDRDIEHATTGKYEIVCKTDGTFDMSIK